MITAPEYSDEVNTPSTRIVELSSSMVHAELELEAALTTHRLFSSMTTLGGHVNTYEPLRGMGLVGVKLIV